MGTQGIKGAGHPKAPLLEVTAAPEFLTRSQKASATDKMETCAASMEPGVAPVAITLEQADARGYLAVQTRPSSQDQRRLDGISSSLKALARQSDTDLAIFDQVSTLAAIANEVSANGPINHPALRAALRRILLAMPERLNARRFVEEHLLDSTLGPNELEAYQAARHRLRRNEILALAEEARGGSPWTARARTSARTVKTPYLIGACPDGDGRLRPLYGDRFFRSERQLEATGPLGSLFGTGWSPLKQVQLQAARYQPVEKAEVRQGTYWNALPADLRERLERGELLMTSGIDAYHVGSAEISRMAEADDPTGLLKAIDQRIVQSAARGGTPYFLLYYSDQGANDVGRTGTLMKLEDGRVSFVTAKIDGQEHVFELKGCGGPLGGLGAVRLRTGNEVVEGGASRGQALRELEQLELETLPGTPRAVGCVLYEHSATDGPEPGHAGLSKGSRPFQLGYIVRLTPSTTRASFTGAACYPEISQQVDRLLKIYATELAEHLLGEHPKVLSRSSHGENIMVAGPELHFVDHSDQVSLADPRLPFEAEKGGYLTPERLIEIHLRMSAELDGFGESSREHLNRELVAAFQARGVALEILPGDGAEQAAAAIARAIADAQVFRQRRKQGYLPEGVIADAMAKVPDEAWWQRHATSAEAFARAWERALDVLAGVAGRLLAAPQNSEHAGLLGRLVEATQRRDASGLLDSLYGRDAPDPYDLTRGVLPDDERDAFHRGNGPDPFFDGCLGLAAVVLRYFDHERKTLEHAAADPALRSAANAAQGEVAQREQVLAETFKNPASVYALLKDPEPWLRKVLPLAAYRGE